METIFSYGDLGDSIATEEAFVGKHDALVKTLEKQGVAIEELEIKGYKLIKDGVIFMLKQHGKIVGS